MSLYFELLKKEEKYRLEEQSALLSSLLSSPSKGKLSILRRAGFAMTGLEVIGRSSGSGARIIIELAPTVYNEDVSMKFGCFKPGEIVKIIVNGLLLNCIGTIERRNKSSDGEISVSLSNNLESEEMELLTEGSMKIALIKVVDEVGMFEKMKNNIETILNYREGGSDLLKFTCEFIKNSIKDNYRINPETETESRSRTESIISERFNLEINTCINREQELAVKKSLEMIQDPRKHLILIHGPPGTGKTSVLLEILKQIRNERKEKKKYKILILGPSNLSVDNIVERLDGDVYGILRIGHPSRVLESCQRSTLDFWSENCDEGKLLKDVQKEIDDLVKTQLPKCKNREERRAIYGELKLLRQERKKREKSLHSDLIKRAEIVACTLSTACGKKLKGMKFDLAVVDEACQALLPETLIAPILADKIIFAGDHYQLPPTVMNPLIKDNLEISLFEHLINRRKGDDFDEVMLKEQYRMNENIMKWSNAKFYCNQLRAHESVSKWKLDLEGCDDESLGDVIIFYDTCGFDLWESVEKSKENKNALVLVEEMSKFNEGEAKIAIEHYKKLLAHGIRSDSIAIISPYSAQVSLIRDQISSAFQPKDQPEINSIDAFQGREKDVVILSMVRSNAEGVVGFLGEMRRINVAMTRAKKQLVIVGDSETLSRDPELTGLIDFLNENATINFP